jgi:hypothetical protein
VNERRQYQILYVLFLIAAALTTIFLFGCATKSGVSICAGVCARVEREVHGELPCKDNEQTDKEDDKKPCDAKDNTEVNP